MKILNLNVLILFLCSSLVACKAADESTATQVTIEPIAAQTNETALAEEVGPEAVIGLTKIQVTHPSGQKVEVELVPIGTPALVSQFAEQTRLSGFACDRSEAVSQLREAGNDLQIYKIDCDKGLSYQLTLLNDKPYLKPWNGILLGN